MRRYYAATLLVLLAGTGAPVRGAQDAPAMSAEWKGCRSADSDTALTACRAIIEAGQGTPADLAKAHYFRAAAYRNKTLLDLAIEEFGEAVKLDPSFTDAWGDRAITLTAVGNYLEAIPDFTRVIEAAPKTAYAYYNRGLCYEILGLDDLAIEDFTASLALTPNDSFKWERRGTVYYRKAQYDLALADYEKSLSLDPQYPPALYARGAVKMKKGDLAGGGADVAQAKYFQENIDRVMERSGVRP